MKKIFIITPVFFIIIGQIVAQQTIHIKNNDTVFDFKVPYFVPNTYTNSSANPYNDTGLYFYGATPISFSLKGKRPKSAVTKTIEIENMSGNCLIILPTEHGVNSFSPNLFSITGKDTTITKWIEFKYRTKSLTGRRCKPLAAFHLKGEKDYYTIQESDIYAPYTNTNDSPVASDNIKQLTPVNLIKGDTIISLKKEDTLNGKPHVIQLKFKLIIKINNDTTIKLNYLPIEQSDMHFSDVNFSKQDVSIDASENIVTKSLYFQTNKASDYKKPITLYLYLGNDLNNTFSITINQVDSNEKTTKVGNNKTNKPKVHLDNSDTIINPLYNKNQVKYIPINIKLYRDTTPTENDIDTVNFTFAKKEFPFLPTIYTPTLILNKKSWTKFNNRGYPELDTSLLIENRAIDSLKSGADLYGEINIKGEDSSYHSLHLSEIGMYNPTAPFWMETGTNIDLLDGVKAQNLYAGIYMFEKDIAKIGNPKRNNLSFTGGVYETKSSSFSASSDSGLLYRNSASLTPTVTTNPSGLKYQYSRDTGSFVTTTDVQSIGIFFSPHLRLTDKKVEENGLHIFLSVYAEMLWQRVKSGFDYSKVNHFEDFNYLIDSAHKGNSQEDFIKKYPYKETGISYDYRSHYYGIGLPIYIKENNFSLYINDIFGTSNQRFVAINRNVEFSTKDSSYYDFNQSNRLNNTFLTTMKKWNPFYILQFRLTEETYGIAFTGEIRGFFMNNSKPVINLSLSKKFDLKEVFHTIVKPFTPNGS